MSNAMRKEIITAEQSYWDAMKAKDGKRTAKLCGYARLVTGARGVTRVPKNKIGKMTEEGSRSLHSYEFRDVEIACPAPNVAIIAYTVRHKVAMDGKSAQLHESCTP